MEAKVNQLLDQFEEQLRDPDPVDAEILERMKELNGKRVFVWSDEEDDPHPTLTQSLSPQFLASLTGDSFSARKLNNNEN